MADNENPETINDDVEGHKYHAPAANDDGDDVEGHKYHAPAANDDGDDVEGHKYHAPAANDDEDDVEGHVKHMGPSLSGAVNPDEAPSSRHL